MSGGKRRRGGVGDLLERGYRYALSLTHDAAGAEDLLQDACVSILRAGGSWHKGYLFKAIRSRFVDLHRRELVAPMERIDDPTQVPQDVDGALGHETIVADADLLRKALGVLRPEEREALYLAGVEGYTAAEIARLTGRPRGTILSMVFRARRKIERFVGQGGMKAER